MPDQDYNEAEVLARAAQGSKDAFGELYQRYIDRIFNYVYYRTGNSHDAEDLTARVFQRAMNHIHNYTDRGVPFSAWLYRIAHNLVANWHRDRSRKQEIPLDELPVLPARGDHPETRLVHTEEQEALLRLIRKLPPERQHLLILKFVENLSNAEIGQVMGRSEGAVKSLYHRTLLALRDQIGEPNQTLEGE
ncbi:MAG: RNA polymerase sigma factor [Chloroflexota bacterium]